MFKKLSIILLILSLSANIILSGWLVFTKINENKANQRLRAQQINEKALSFEKLFVEKVLNSRNEISFEDRLQLENAVRQLNDQAIFIQWQKFTKSENNEDAQLQAGNLFTLLINKISY